MPIRKLLFAAALSALAFSFACDLNKTSAQFTAKHVIVATLLHTPAVEVRPEAIAGLDNLFADSGFSFDGGFTFDGGIPFDAGGLFADAGFTIPPQTAVFAFFGTRNGEGLMQSAPTPISGSTMSVQVKGGTELALKDLGEGTFALLSQDEPKLDYQSNGDYLFTAKGDSDTFTGIAEKVPAQETIPQFHPSPRSYIDLDAGSDFSFRRPDAPSGAERDLGFVLVFPVDRQGKQGVQTYTNVPAKPVDFLKLVVAPADWKKTTVTVPGSAFPEHGKNYIILLQSAKLGHPDTENLFIGSAIIGGSADIGIVKTY